MEIFVQTLAYWTNEEALDYAIKNEFDGVEIIEGLYRDPSNFDIKTFLDYKSIGLKFLYHITPMFYLGSIDDYYQKALIKQAKYSLKVANELETPFVTLHIFEYGSGRYSARVRRKLFEKTAKGVKELLKYFQDYDIKMSLEIGPNYDREYMNKCLTLKDAIKIAKIDEDYIRLLYDAEHLYSTGTPPLQAVKKITKYISYVHASDNDYSGTHMHLPLGEGKFPWKKIIDFLKRKDYRGPISIEATHEEDIRKSKLFLIKTIKSI